MTALATIARLHKLTWTLVYGGLLLLVLGLSVQRLDSLTGWWMCAAGILLLAAGVTLIYVRSRLTVDV